MKENMPKHYLVFDTETIGLHDLNMFDIGIVILDNKGNLIHTEEALINEVYNSPKIHSAYYYGKNKEFYNNANIKIRSIKDIRFLFNSLIKEYNVNRILACNTNFDIRVLNFMFKQYNLGKNINKHKLSKVGIKIGDLQKIFIGNVNITKYIKFCLENNLITGKGNIQYGVESIIKFIIGKDYKEQHTALADALDEAIILNYIMKLPKFNLDKEIKSPTHYIKKIRKSI